MNCPNCDEEMELCNVPVSNHPNLEEEIWYCLTCGTELDMGDIE